MHGGGSQPDGRRCRLEHGSVGSCSMNDTDDRSAQRRRGSADAVGRRLPVPGVRFGDLTPVFADGAGCAASCRNSRRASRTSIWWQESTRVGSCSGRAWPWSSAAGCWPCARQASCRRRCMRGPTTSNTEPPSCRSPDGIDLAGRRVLVVDDVLATGGTVDATARLLDRRGAVIVGAAVVLEIDGAGGASGRARARCLVRWTKVCT